MSTVTTAHQNFTTIFDSIEETEHPQDNGFQLMVFGTFEGTEGAFTISPGRDGSETLIEAWTNEGGHGGHGETVHIDGHEIDDLRHAVRTALQQINNYHAAQTESHRRYLLRRELMQQIDNATAEMEARRLEIDKLAAQRAELITTAMRDHDVTAQDIADQLQVTTTRVYAMRKQGKA